MHKRKIVGVLAGVSCVGACFIAYQLTMKHVTGAAGPSWFEAGCAETTTGGGANCAAVLASPYSFFPKKVAGEERPIPRVPVALLGWLYYSVMLVWMIGVGMPSSDRKLLHTLPILLGVSGILASAYYTFIMFTKLEEWCPWCLVTHALNVLMFICLIVLRCTRKTPADESRLQPEEGDDTQRRVTMVGNDGVPTPGRRLVLVTVLMILVVMFSEMSWVSLKSWKRNTDTCQAAYEHVTAGGKIFLASWLKNTKHEEALESDAPTRGGGSALGDSLQVLVFSDFACPSCRAVADFLETKAQPLFDGRLAISFRHFPLHRECNPETTTNKHPHACFGARLAESAKALGGDDAFWRTHDYLFENQANLKAGLITTTVVAEHLKLDPASLEDGLDAPFVAERIASDAHMGRALGLVRTPTILVDGRLIERGAKMNLNFWNKLSDWYWQHLKQPRPPKTLLHNATKTP